jgi:hypothetical protein
MTPSGIEPVTFWFVAQYLNHCATAVPLFDQYNTIYDCISIRHIHYDMFRPVMAAIFWQCCDYVKGKKWGSVYCTRSTLYCFHRNNGYGNAPQCYVIRTLPILFNFTLAVQQRMKMYPLAVKGHHLGCYGVSVATRLRTQGCLELYLHCTISCN